MYVKLFTSIYQGTLRGNSRGLLVFTNLLAHCDRDGVVDIHPRAIAEEVGLSVQDVRAALDELEAPDEESRSPDEGGRRIMRIDEHRAWGWRVVNYAKYRAIKNEDDRREANRAAVAKHRAKKAESSTVILGNAKSSVSAQAEGDGEEEAEGGNTPPAPKGAKTPALGIKAWLVTVRESGAKPIPEGDPVFAYADRVGIPSEFLALAWCGFKHRYLTQHPDKRYKDWRRVFRNAVEGNWLKFWWLDPASNTYALTTVGQQAKLDHDAKAKHAAG